MPADSDLLFGKIAVAKGYCTQAQVDECVLMQSYEESPPPLGDILLYKGYITSEQHAEILAAQAGQLATEDPATRAPKDAVLFGKLAVREKFLTQDQLNECLRLQAKEGETRSLGEIMVAKGYLTPQQVKALLSRQLKRIMVCPNCKLSFTVLSLSEGRKVDCPRCRGPLQDAPPQSPPRTDAEFSTMVLRAAKSSLPPHVKPETRQMPAVVKTVICDKEFEGPLDSTGRIRCPSCHTTFTPR